MNITIKVPVKPYIKNYILCKSGEAPLILSLRSNCIILDKLYDLLSRPGRRPYGRERPKVMQEYTEFVTVLIKSWPSAVAGLHLTDEKIHHFNVFIDKIIKERLFIQLDTMFSMLGFEAHPEDIQKDDLPINLKQTIESYLLYYDLEEGGLKCNSLERAYLRYRQQSAALAVPPVRVNETSIFAA